MTDTDTIVAVVAAGVAVMSAAFAGLQVRFAGRQAVAAEDGVKLANYQVLASARDTRLAAAQADAELLVGVVVSGLSLKQSVAEMFDWVKHTGFGVAVVEGASGAYGGLLARGSRQRGALASYEAYLVNLRTYREAVAKVAPYLGNADLAATIGRFTSQVDSASAVVLVPVRLGYTVDKKSTVRQVEASFVEMNAAMLDLRRYATKLLNDAHGTAAAERFVMAVSLFLSETPPSDNEDRGRRETI